MTQAKRKHVFESDPINGSLGLGTSASATENDEPVTCLGITFENDAARRAYFTEELRKKLKCPEFRKIEGFPIGEDEDILALSDPPYYTACPNPWIGDFIKEWEAQKPPKPEGWTYHREPFAADVSEGKSDPIYKAHSYHTKVPHKAVMRYILHYTEPGDIIFDGFCGSGMTGIAAQLCEDVGKVSELGCLVEPSGAVLHKNEDEPGSSSLLRFSKVGTRYAILKDLSPAAAFIAAMYNSKFEPKEYTETFNLVFRQLQEQIGWMYETLHTDGRTVGRINFTVWSEVFICNECGSEIVFFKEAFDTEKKKVRKDFPCRACGSTCDKASLSLAMETYYQGSKTVLKPRPKRVPVLVNYTVGEDKYEKSLDTHDLEVLSKVRQLPYPHAVPTLSLPDMQMASVGRMKTTVTECIPDFFLDRQAHALGCLWHLIGQIASKPLRQRMYWTIEQSIPGMSILNRYQPSHFSQVNRQMAGVFYVPSQISECSPWFNLEGKVKRVSKALSLARLRDGRVGCSTGNCASTGLPPDSIDYIFTDPPFGENIYYSDLNFLVEAWHRVKTNPTTEAIIDRKKNKALLEYQAIIQRCFNEYYRVLKPGRWITIEFSNTKAAVWNSIQTAIGNAGFIIASVSALKKGQGTFQAVNTPTAVKQDLVISAYKPNGGLEERFGREAQTEEGVWDFIRTHLKYISITKIQNGLLQFIPERDSRILFDQMVAYYVRKGYPVPLSSQDFQVGLAERFSERDGMYFLPEQVAEYDQKKIRSGQINRYEDALFVKDESTAIDWLRARLRDKPQPFSDLNPLFMQKLGGWSKNESQLDLRELLQQNFLCYDGKGPVPEQIHAYLSTNWKDLRNLAKDDPALVAKARDRWYVPDPNKAGDLERLRERALLKEFEEYKTAKKKLKVFRLEAVRAGFKKAWQERDYNLIISVAEKIPHNVLEEDPKLLMWYDQAITRVGGE